MNAAHEEVNPMKEGSAEIVFVRVCGVLNFSVRSRVGGHLEYKKAWFQCVTENGFECCSIKRKIDGFGKVRKYENDIIYCRVHLGRRSQSLFIWLTK